MNYLSILKQVKSQSEFSKTGEIIFMDSRVNYIDNLRTAIVSLLIIYHLGIAYNSWGEANYIFFERVNFIASIVVFISSWFMPLMFLLAGVSAAFSIKKRGYSDFIKERFTRLGIPLLFGITIINPILSFIADKSHNGYEGNYFEHYLIYFTRFTDLTGYDGGFTLGHFWFIAVLIIISCLACGVIKLIDGISRNNRKIMLTINCFIIIVAIAVFDVAFWGKRIPAYLCVYLLGYYLFSSQEFIKKLVKVKIVFVFVFVLSSMMNAILFVYIEDYALLNNICNYLSYITGISALICLAKEYLDYSNKVSRYCARLSYVFYIVHFPIVVLCQYFISLTGVGSVYNFVLSLLISTILTCSVCCMIEKNTVVSHLFGLRKNKVS